MSGGRRRGRRRCARRRRSGARGSTGGAREAVRGSARAEAGESCTAQEGLRGRGAHPDLGVRLAHSLRKVEYGIRKTGARALQKSEIRNTGLLRKVEYGIQTRTEYRQGALETGTPWREQSAPTAPPLLGTGAIRPQHVCPEPLTPAERKTARGDYQPYFVIYADTSDA